MRNFKSFKQETSLSAEAGERLRKYQDTNTVIVNNKHILKNLLIFGPNGSGKSNLLDGLKCMQTMILNNPVKVTDLLPYNGFILDSSSEDTNFNVIFSIGKDIYEYEFSYNRKEITFERLSKVLKTRKKVYFEREQNKFKSDDQSLMEIARRTKRNSLVLYTAMQNNIKIPTEIFTWFSENLIFVGDYRFNSAVSELIGLAKDESVKEQLLNFLHFADFNIIDLEVNEQPALGNSLEYSADLPMMNQLFAVHKVYNDNGDLIGKRRLSINSESQGTQKILMIALSFINAEINGDDKTLLFDEFDDSLHLELSQAMVKIFNSKTNKNQFILTTHELQLLDSDVRVDQIYLVEKDFKGESELASIFDFKDTRNTTRSGISYMKRYFEGRFGATPIIDSDEMLDALTNNFKN